MAIPLAAPGASTRAGIQTGQDFMAGIEKIKASRQSRKESQQRIEQSVLATEKIGLEIDEYKKDVQSGVFDLERLNRIKDESLKAITKDASLKIHKKNPELAEKLQKAGVMEQFVSKVVALDASQGEAMYAINNKLENGLISYEEARTQAKAVNPEIALPEDEAQGSGVLSAAAEIAGLDVPLKKKLIELGAAAGDNRAKLAVEDVNVDIPQEDGSYKTIAVQRTNQGQFLGTDGQPLQLPEGTRLTTTGKTGSDLSANASQLTTAQKGKAQGRLLSASRKLDNLASIANKNLAKFLSTKGRATSAIGKILDFGTGLGGETAANVAEAFTGVNPIEFAAESRTLFEDLEGFFNEHRKDITGAAAAFAELKQLRSSVLNGDLPPAQAVASLNRLLTRVQADMDRTKDALSEGIDLTKEKGELNTFTTSSGVTITIEDAE